MASRVHSGQRQRETSPRKVKLTLESTTDSTNQAAGSVVPLAKRLRYNDEQCHDIELAVREVVANAILHGNRSDRGKRVFLTASGGPSGLVIHVRDEGEGFEPSSVPDPRQAEALMQESGRGMLLINACMDEVTWRPSPEGGMEVILKKNPAGGRATPGRNGKKA